MSQRRGPSTRDPFDDAAVLNVDDLALPDEPLAHGSATNTRFAIPTMGDVGTDVGPTGAQRARASDEARRVPVPVERRPTMMGLESSLPPAPRTVRPGVMEPVRARNDAPQRDVGESREGSDVISSFQSGAEPAPIAGPTGGPPTLLQDRARSRLERRPPRTAGMAPQVAPPLPSSARPVAAAVAGARVLPLDAERLSAMIADQRRRLHVLDTWARVMEVAAGILGSLSLAVAVVAVVASLLAAGPSLLLGASALIGAMVGIGLSIGLIVGAVMLRQLAHVSAQQAALLEALCQPPRGG